MKAKIKPVTSTTGILCPVCSAPYPGIKYRIKRGKIIITEIPEETQTCMRCLEERLAA